MKGWKFVLAVFSLPLMVVLAWIVLFAYDATAPTPRDMKEQGRVLVGAVEAFRIREGRYPATLLEAGIQAPSPRCGPWRYARDGQSFTLGIGNYGRDGFVLRYVGAERRWHEDT